MHKNKISLVTVTKRSFSGIRVLRVGELPGTLHQTPELQGEDQQRGRICVVQTRLQLEDPLVFEI